MTQMKDKSVKSVQSVDKLVVEIKGVDVYDPTTGEIRSSSTDDIACWFIDTDYNEESFFVRHAYFTGADEPYDKLKRALRAEVDEADISLVRLGQHALIQADAYGDRRFMGQVARIGNLMGRKRVLSEDPGERQDTRVLEVLINLEANTQLPAGLRVDVFIEIGDPG